MCFQAHAAASAVALGGEGARRGPRAVSRHRAWHHPELPKQRLLHGRHGVRAAQGHRMGAQAIVKTLKYDSKKLNCQFFAVRNIYQQTFKNIQIRHNARLHCENIYQFTQEVHELIEKNLHNKTKVG